MQGGGVDRAFNVLAEMRTDGRLAPDQIMYNPVIDGCMKRRHVDDALRVLEAMKVAGVGPPNYTLSVLVSAGCGARYPPRVASRRSPFLATLGRLQPLRSLEWRRFETPSIGLGLF